ncbi:hypothetical protein [Aestuariibacter salexigens]|uniref:hypothetical protein n=1 Tax=Aestuariibacter salexigens TaxID=226010 RepID=UPI000418E0F6|nr:hypothetical protein [Aestuariibacter salexigens]
MKKLIPLSEASSYETLYTHKFYSINDIQLEFSKPIKKGELRGIYPELGRDSSYSSRVGETGGLPKAIQYYRMWFLYLKLALECEQKQIEVVIKPNTYTKRAGGRTTFHVPRETKYLTVDREFYKDWSLDEVLVRSFDSWWKDHRYLFEASIPEVITDKTVETDDDHVYLKIDKRFNWDDLHIFLNKEIRRRINQPHKYQVVGKARYIQLLNRYNAVVCCMHGMSAKQIFTDRACYMRAPDEAGTRVDVGGSLAVSETKSGKLKYSGAFRRQYDGGIFHLLEVCEGRFGAGFSKQNKTD